MGSALKTSKLFTAALAAVMALSAMSFISCSCNGDKKVELTLIQVTPVDEEITMEMTQQYQATGIFSDGTNEDLTARVAWASTDEAVATIDENGLATPAGAGETTIQATYVGVTGSTTLTVIEKDLERIVVDPATATLAIGTTVDLTATGHYTDGSTEDLTGSADWSSSDDAVATVTAGGVVEGMGGGAATITATVGSFSDTSLITVLAGVQCEDLNIRTVSGDYEVPVGMTLHFVADCDFSDGVNRDVTTQVTWASSDTAVASISNDTGSNGDLTGESEGTADITAVFENGDGTETTSNTQTVTVTNPPLEEIQVTPVAEVSHGEDVQYTATCVYSDSSTLDCTTDVTWSSSDEAVATISNAAGEEGLAAPHANGTTNITASHSGVTSNTAVLVVSTTECTSIDVTPAAPATLPIGLTQQFTATCTYGDGSTDDVTTSVTWASSNESVATISNGTGTEGLATGVAAGSTQITATLDTVVSSAVTLNVSDDVVPVSILVEPASLTIPEGGTASFTATVTFSDSSTRDVTAESGCTWSSSNTAVATVSAGTVTAVAEGSASITATYSGLSDAKPVTVIPEEVETIEVIPSSRTIPLGTDFQFTAMGHYTDGSVLNITTLVTWTSSATATATISNALGSEGLAHGVSEGGPVTITAAHGTVSGTAQLTVSPEVVQSINVTPALPDDLPIGLTQEFTATCTYSDSSTRDCTTDTALTWASSNTGIATISNAPADKGTATAVALGSTQITAAVGTVVSPPVVLHVTTKVLESIEVSPDPGRLPTGFSIGFTATGHYSDGSTDDITTSVTWSSSASSVATISNLPGIRGLAHGVAPGSAVITATEPVSGVDGSGDLTVTTAVLSSIQVTPATLDLNEGETHQFEATGFFNDGTTLDITEDVTWTTYLCPSICSGGAGSTISNLAGSRGFFTAGAYGTVAVYCSHPTVGFSADSYVDIFSTSLDHVVVSLPRNDVPTGHNFQAACEAYYSDGRHNDVTDSATWASTVTTVATVSNSPGSEGLISTIGAGNTDISCTFGGQNSSAQLRVHTCTLNTIDVVPNDPTASVGTTVQFTANGFYGAPCSAAAFNMTSMVTWNSSNTAVATVSNAPGTKGLATVVASTGFSDIEGRLGTVFEVSRLTATGACYDSIYITPSDPAIPVDVDVDLDAYGCRSDDASCSSPVEINNANLNWQTSAPGTASVSSAGLVTGNAEGSATITATLTSGACTPGENATTDVTVNDATLQSITIQPDGPTVGRGEQVQFTALGSYSDGSSHDITNKVAWASTVGSIATIDAAGLATADDVNEGTTTITAALSGVTGYTTLTVSGKTLQSLAVSVSPAQPAQGYPVGIYVQFTCTATYSDSSTANLTSSASFASSNETVLSVDNGATTKGRGTTQAVGSSNVTCTSGTVTSPNFAVTVNSATLQTITVAPASASINKGTQQQFTATGNYSNGTSFPVTRRATWSSSNTAVATLSNTEPTQGLATASTTNEGTVTVTAIYGSITGTGQLTVGGACIDHIEVTPTSTSVAAGYNASFTATAVYSDASTSNITATASWSSSDTDVATVAGGTAHGVAVGSAVITASTSANTCSGSAETDEADLTVTDAPLTGITVSCASTNPPPGLQTQCRAYGTYSDGTSGVDITTQVGWSSTNTAVATVNDTDAKGLVSAVAAGNATITATQGTIQGTQAVVVPSCTLQSIDVTPNNQNVPRDFTVQYQAAGTWSAACGTHDISAFVTWASSNTSVATISTGGLATTVAVGTTSITANYLGIPGTEPLTVNDAVLNNIDVEAGTCTGSLPRGTTCKMEARGYYTDGSNRLVTELATWSSNNTDVATAGNSPGDRGRITGVAAGSAVITAVVDTHSDNRVINVSGACLQGIQVTPADPSFPVDVPVAFTATGIYSDTSTANITGSVAWDSTDTGVIGVPGSTGAALTIGTGTSTVSAQVSSGTCSGNPVTGTTLVTVTTATLDSIDVTPEDPSVPNGRTQQFTAWGNYSDSSRHNITTLVTWSSANTAVATISNAPGSRGLAEAHAMGTTLISATKSLVSGSTDMSVSDAVLTGITVITDTPYVGYDDGDTVRFPEGGLHLQFHAMGTFSDASFREVTDTVAWSSNNDTAASVSGGLVTTGTVTGDTTVRITAASGSISGYLDIVVMNGAPSAITITDGLGSIANGTSTRWNCTATMGSYQYYITRDTVWSSDNTAIATVSNADDEWGVVSGHSVGSTTIWANWSTLSTNRPISVTGAVLSYVSVSPSTLTVVTDASFNINFHLYIIGHFTDSTTQDLTSPLGYWVANPHFIGGAVGSPDWYTRYTSYYQGLGICDTTTTIAGCYGGLCSDAAHSADVFIDCP